MFENIGGKIKGLATATCWIGIVISIILGIVSGPIVGGLTGLIISAVGSLLSWVGSFVLYALGEITESLKYLAQGKANEIGETNEHDTGRIRKAKPVEQFIVEKRGTCGLCETSDVALMSVEIRDDMGIRYRDVCPICYEKYNCERVNH